MTRTLTTTAVASTKKTINPMDQPCFSTWVHHYNTHGTGYTCYDHNFNIIDMNMGDGDYHYNKYRSYSSYSPEMLNTWHNYDYIATEGGRYPSSSNNYGSNTTWHGFLGHLCHQSPGPYSSKGGWMTGWPGVNRNAYSFRDVGTLPNEQTQDYAIFGNHNGGTGTYFSVGPRSKLWYYDTVIQRNQGRFNIVPPSGYQGMYGSISYNPKIKKMAVMHSKSNWEHKPCVWNSVPDLRAYGNTGGAYYRNSTETYSNQSDSDTSPSHSLGQYFQDTNNRNDSYSAWNTSKGSWGGWSESYWRGHIVLCDNGAIVMHSQDADSTGGYAVRRWAGPTNMESGNGGTLNAYDHELIYHTHWGGHNVYGYEQGDRFGVRFGQSTDGRYVWMYNQAYYYGAGYCWSCVRVADGKTITYQEGSGTHGYHFCPIGKSSMLMGSSDNADNPGYYFRTMNLDTIFELYHDKDQVNIKGSDTTYVLNVCGNSTNYPQLVPAIYDTAVFSDPQYAEIKRS